MQEWDGVSWMSGNDERRSKAKRFKLENPPGPFSNYMLEISKNQKDTEGTIQLSRIHFEDSKGDVVEYSRLSINCEDCNGEDDEGSYEHVQADDESKWSAQLSAFPKCTACFKFEFDKPFVPRALVLTSASDKPEADPSSFALRAFGQGGTGEAGTGEGPLAAEYDQMTFFIDGERKGSIARPSAVPTVRSVGGSLTDADQNFGLMAELLLFKKALVPEEITALYKHLAPPEKLASEAAAAAILAVDKKIADLKEEVPWDREDLSKLQEWWDSQPVLQRGSQRASRLDASETTERPSIESVDGCTSIEFDEKEELNNKAMKHFVNTVMPDGTLALTRLRLITSIEFSKMPLVRTPGWTAFSTLLRETHSLVSCH